MSKIINGVEYNYEIRYVENGVSKVASRATTSSEADNKKALALTFFEDETVQKTVEIVTL